ncbi:unnamed protein product [Lampetra planeri]
MPLIPFDVGGIRGDSRSQINPRELLSRQPPAMRPVAPSPANPQWQIQRRSDRSAQAVQLHRASGAEGERGTREREQGGGGAGAAWQMRRLFRGVDEGGEEGAGFGGGGVPESMRGASRARARAPMTPGEAD